MVLPPYAVKYLVVLSIAVSAVAIHSMRDNVVNRKHARIIWLRFCCNLRWLHIDICCWPVVGLVTFIKLFGLVLCLADSCPRIGQGVLRWIFLVQFVVRHRSYDVLRFAVR